MYTHLEDYIYNLLLSIKITEIGQLNINNVSERLNVIVAYEQQPIRIGNEIFLKRCSKQREWQEFGHELGHLLRHVGNQLNMYPLFIDLQEHQANCFAYHFCVPTFMLQTLKEVTVYEVMNLFNVEYDFAIRRMEMYRSKRYERVLNNALS